MNIYIYIYVCVHVCMHVQTAEYVRTRTCVHIYGSDVGFPTDYGGILPAARADNVWI